MFSIQSFARYAQFAAFCALLLLISACTPALNWRDVRLESADGSTLKAALPCKPDAATRKQQLGGILVDLSMMGCVVNDATFTLSRIPVLDPLSAPKLLAAWQAAAEVNVEAGPTPTTTVIISGAGAWPPAARVTLAGATSQAQIVWFAKQSSTGLTLYQAGMYGKQAQKDGNTETTNTFFESLQLQ
jgi:hypothetical protein